MWSPFALIRAALRWFKIIFRRVFIITLPLTLFYLGLGGIVGLLLADYETRLYFTSLRHVEENFASAQELDWFSVPGAPGIHDLGVAPYFVPQLRDPTNWWTKLGLKRFDVSPVLDDNDTPLNQFALPNSLYRRTDKKDEGACWHHWVYASDQILHFDDLFFSPWDSAFNQLLQYHYANPAPCNASFHYLTCPGSFLCDIWKTRGPALIHFTTEKVDLWPDEDEIAREAVAGYTPVTARIIEFPITRDGEMTLTPGVFPTPFNQMKSVTSDPYIWQAHVPWTAEYQTNVRLEEIIESKSRAYPRSFGRAKRLERWLFDKVIQPCGLEIPRSLIAGVGMVTSALGWRCVEFVGESISAFLGAEDAKRRDREAWMEEERAAMGQREPNFLAQMMRDFFDTERGSVYEKKLEASPEGQEALNNIWNIVRKGAKGKGESRGDDDENIEAQAM
ncbi:unnamed protein product [Clonostachys rosea]|uniref:Glycosyl transferase CAP10 domain-containing protein n=1 Tax=Bionectria ochroleuca TaxID=29856 RepID=A0ABY6UJE8_BIOOC|nr:unnamed protein product [Clonostachys rosea]